MADHDEFYTGYLPDAPPGIARRTRLATIAFVVLAAVLAVVFAAGQNGFSKGVFEFGVVKEFEGVVRATPYPVLEVEKGEGQATSAGMVYYLVNPFKHGAEVTEHVDQRIRVRGSLIYRDGRTMLEILPETVESLGAATAPSVQPMELRTMRGRIVDAKCFLGVMKPGDGRVHRACALRCISGGVPPLFIEEMDDGTLEYYLLVGQDGRALNDEVLDVVADPIEIDGDVVLVDGVLTVRAEPSEFRNILRP